MTPNCFNSNAERKVTSGSEISILLEFISFKAILVALTICLPISALSPDNGTNKPILILFSSDKLCTEIKIKLKNNKKRILKILFIWCYYSKNTV